LAAIGGSDEHTPGTADQRVGRPTTVAFVQSLSERAIVGASGQPQ
jgi:hypothetical protein